MKALLKNRIVYAAPLWLTMLCLLNTPELVAQRDSVRGWRRLDSSFIRSYYGQLDLGLEYGSQYMEYQIHYSDSFFIALRPNEVFTLTPTFNYRWLSVSYAFTPGFMDLNNDDALRGSTRYRRLSTSLSFDQFLASGQWSRTRGFYLANMQSIYPNWLPGDPYLLFPSMEVQQVLLNLNYRTHKNFSLKAIQGGEEEQLKSAWTLLPGLNIAHFKFNVPGSDSLAGKIDLTNNFDINLVAPVAGTWVFARHATVTGLAGPLLGVDFFKSYAFDRQKTLVESKGINMSSGFYFGITLGYNHPRWYLGISNRSSRYRHAINNTERMGKIFTQFSIYGGLRLKPHRLLKKSLDWTEKLLPILQ